MTHALTHFFGSTDGYRTLARAPGVTDAEDAALAALGFGSPRTQADFDALESEPCMAGRLLPSGRFAITRVFQGEPDIAGRQTVERRTLIVDTAVWADLAACDLWATLAQPSVWSRRAFAAGEQVEFEACPGEDLLPAPGEDERRAFDAMLEAQRTGRCATLPNDARWRRALLRLASFLPRERAVGFGWGVGLWAVPAGVWVSTLRPDAQPRHSFPARLSGAWMHAREVERLGDERPTQPDTRRPKPERAKVRRAPAPWVVGAVVAVTMIATALWFTLAAGQGSVQPATEARSGALAPAMQQTIASSAPATETVQPPNAATDAAPGAAPTQASTPAHAPPPTAATPAAATASPTPSAGFGAAATDPSFGSGTSASTEAVAQRPPPQSTAPAATATPAPAPAPTPAPAPPPQIPPAPDESTSWDAQVALLRDSIDLADRARSFAARGAPDPDGAVALAQELAAWSTKLRAQAQRVELELTSSPSRGADRRIFYADALQPGTLRAEYGASKSFNEALTLGAFPPAIAQQVALLAARFEIAQAAQALLRSPLGETDGVRKTLKDEEAAGGWPSSRPFEQWMHHKEGKASNTSSKDAERFMADEFAKRLAGTKGMSGIVRQLRRIAPPPAAPAPKAP